MTGDNINSLKEINEAFLRLGVPNLSLGEGSRKYIHKARTSLYVVHPERARIPGQPYKLIEGRHHADISVMRGKDDEVYRTVLDFVKGVLSK